MKKYFWSVFTLILIVALVFSSCGTATKSGEVTNPHETASSFKVVIVQSDDSLTYAEMRKAFIARMRTLGYDEAKMKFDIKNAMGDEEKLNKIAEELVNSSYDLIIPIATKAAVAVSKTDNKIPSVFIGVTDPVASGLTSSLEKPDKNMTGSVYKNDIAELAVLSDILTPNVKSIGIIYSKDNQIASSTVNSAKAVFTDKAISYEELVVESNTDIEASVTDLFTRVDAVLITEDIAIENKLDSIISIANANQKFVFASSEADVKAGALISVSTSITALSKNSAQLADKIIQGKNISDVAISEEAKPVKFISKSTSGKMKVEIPELEDSQIL